MILTTNIGEKPLSGNELKNYRRKKRILDLLYHKDTLSATEIGKAIGVSLPTSLSLLKDLSASGFIESRGTGKSKGGRRPVLFGLSKGAVFIVSCELGRYTAKIGIFDSHNELVSPVITFDTSIDDEQLVDKIWSQYLQILKTSEIQEQRIYAIGVSMPGLIDETLGINHTIKNPELRNVNKRLKKKFNKLIYINNDARMQAYGEFIFGAARGHNNALILNWNWGLGLGMILDGKLYNGATGFAGELSHTKFIDNGELCICGKNGCLETVISVYAIVKQAREGVEAGKVSQLATFKGKEEEITVEDVIQAAKTGDEYAISILNTVGRALGKSLANTIQLLNPDIIVLGGIVSTASQHVLTPLQQAIEKHCLEQIAGNVRLVVSPNWERSGLLGIAAMLFQKLFSDMHK